MKSGQQHQWFSIAKSGLNTLDTSCAVEKHIPRLPLMEAWGYACCVFVLEPSKA